MKTILYKNGQAIRIPEDLAKQKIAANEGYSRNKPSQSGDTIAQQPPNLLKFLIFMNTAEQSALEELDGVGPGTSQKILDRQGSIDSLSVLNKINNSVEWEKLAREYR
ncbi:MAG: hypothetical protein J7647_32125 [Cyanobacteria bacterium SBLK]|nr:hypothetical protein [Cyanobacteria bacterium SBLK]